MDFAWLSQIAFKSLGCNPNSNAISVQFLEYFSENVNLWEEKQKEREREIFSSTRSYLSLCWLLERTWRNGSRFYNLLLFILVCRCITFHRHPSQVRTWQKTSLIKDPWGVSFLFWFFMYTPWWDYLYIFLYNYTKPPNRLGTIMNNLLGFLYGSLFQLAIFFHRLFYCF